MSNNRIEIYYTYVLLGRVVNMISGLGRFAVPMRSPYVLTKYAVEGLSDCLRYINFMFL